MSQHTLNIPNILAANFRAAVNAALQALASLSSGADEPSETYPYMPWANTRLGWLQQRNATDDGWIDRVPLGDGTPVEVPSAATIDLDAEAIGSNVVRITGTESISAVTLSTGQRRTVISGGAFTLVHSAGLVIPGATSYAAAVGDVIELFGDISGVRVTFGVVAGLGRTDRCNTWTKGQRGAESALPATTGAVTLDLAQSNNWGGTLTGNIVLANSSSMPVGQSGVIRLVNGATAYTIAYGAYWKPVDGATLPALTAAAAACDDLVYYVESATRVIVGRVGGSV